MSESFAELFEESLQELAMTPGTLVTGTVVDIDADWVTVNAGLKSEAVIPRSQFLNDANELEINIGDDVKVALEAVEDGFGETKLSREKAKRAEAWEVLQTKFEAEEIVKGYISGKVKGGFTVNVNNIQGFLPGSLVDVRPVRDVDHLEGKELEFKLIKLDQKRNNVVVSRRAVLQEANSAQRDEILADLEEGQAVKGYVKNLTNYGAFIDLGGVDGLLHITDMAWKRISHPSEMLTPGDEIDVKIIKFDKESGRISLGLKQLSEDPWEAIKNRYPAGTRVSGKVTNLTDYGCFASLEDGVEGLVHVSEMSWTNKNIHPSKIVQVGDAVEVMVLDVDEERRRISLGIKQCTTNPWAAFSEQYAAGDKVSGTIKTITDFGIFVGLDNDLDGLVHMSDITWEADAEAALRDYKKGDEVEAVILSIDAEKERISLGVKQLESDPFSEFLAGHEKGAIVTGTVTAVEPRAATVELAEGIEAVLKASDIAAERIEDATTALNVGDSVEGKIVGVDRRNRVITFSIRAKDQAEEKAALKAVQNAEVETAGPTTIGDLIKQQMGQ
ncbi:MULTISPECIES: 30S ribosomal protein S1 [unclassified Marinobacterium]|jgi:small subunit ribosomal protein S1|uniref:30S ribosomal protein S1 n=1 Tax=unclassified Marinobacterium TaxID=2644139 RepID=UPI00156916DB|nr:MULTISPECIES: 30S ribosomal protein S1 [unclassified Marinobacterium]NRP10291.1 30S ribosomal protein S1 [Marinobacterium sp. xm-g-48]NRP15661.1 30S ribosomal protein S1 [Marinobacterium sp. xm-a-152]NRP28397.1 30S ribosomal protein S1 [Marinobacterium sp. xm-d-420]NRP37182.1 30S ribosomal protein S1 [Marinobacterium sp. xm-d-579]NRP38224.1 30S ribosomal protein S1 [Marinobacterium sp. xm-a-121]